ncbi:MAG TPA: hypothetical protein VMH35_19995 [Streptosporangiaceae bacterium]|nr:hypothetical protein [Streptosporangiaceae bacterium]
MLDGLDYDDSDSPAIGLVPVGVPWEDVHDHIKIAHGPLLVVLGGTGEYSGVYWTGRDAVLVEELGSDPEQAIDEFRAVLQERGET